MAKLTTDKALSILIDSEQAKKVLKPSYIRQVKHRLKTGKNLELSKKIEILEKLGAVANELTWNVKTNGKTDLKKQFNPTDQISFCTFHIEPNEREAFDNYALTIKRKIEKDIAVMRKADKNIGLIGKMKKITEKHLLDGITPTDLI